MPVYEFIRTKVTRCLIEEDNLDEAIKQLKDNLVWDLLVEKIEDCEVTINKQKEFNKD